MTDHELRIAIAREIFKWRSIQVDSDDDEITATNPLVLTTVPMRVPDWPNDDGAITRLERTVARRGWNSAYHRELGKVAGDLNPSPSGRQRCEAALLAARNHSEVI